MKLPQLKNFKWNYTALAFAIPCLGMLCLMLIAGSSPFGGLSMLYSDMYHQYYPFFVAYRRALLSGDSLLYSWNVGMGMDYLGLISYYLASPLNLLSVLVPESWLLPLFSLFLPLRLGLAGMFFAIFLKKLFHKDDLSISIFGALYALCAWALGYQWNLMWLDTFALLPLVILGEISLLRNRKFLLYTLTLFLSVFSNYYVGFFTCIFVFLSFVCYEICCWKGFKRFFADLMWMALFSVIAIAMTAILELPALAALQTTQSTVNQFPKGFKLNIADKNTWLGLLDAMRQVAGNMNGGITPTFKEGLPNLYCGVITTLLAMVFLTCPQIRLRDKLCSLGLLVFFSLSFIIRQLDYIWHGFHFPNMIPYRFSFLFSFVLLVMAYRAWLLRRKFQTWQVIIGGILSLNIFFCSEALSDFTKLLTGKVSFLPADSLENVFLNIGTFASYCSFVAYNLIFLGVYFFFLFYSARRKPVSEETAPAAFAAPRNRWVLSRRTCSYLLLAAVGLELVFNLVNFGVSFSFTNVGLYSYPRGGEDAADIIEIMHEREKNTLFYRAEVTHAQTLNDGALNNYNGISTFTSSANVRVTRFMQALGYGAKDTYNRYCFEDSSPVANLFLNLQYMIERDGNVIENMYFDDLHYKGNVHLLENNAYLPLGFLANSQLKDVVFTTNSPFILQNNLIKAATGMEEDVWTFVQGDYLSVQSSDVTVNSFSATGYCSYDAPSGGTISYNYTADKEGFLCINLNLPKRNSFRVLKNGTRLYSETYSLPQMLAVSDVVPGDVITIELTCAAGENSNMTVNAAILDETLFRQAHSILAASTLELTEFSNTKISGLIQCNRDGLLYTSIPQNGNWSATVDGKPAEIVLVGDAMVALELTEGYHEIQFTYHNAAFSLGWKISLGAAVLLAVLYFLLYRPKRMTGKYEKPRKAS